MKLVFVGADHEVTGSCHYLEVAGKHILVDYGMEQGINVFENVPLPVAESMIDYVFLTHAHVVRSLPLQYDRGSMRGSKNSFYGYRTSVGFRQHRSLADGGR